MATAVQPHLEFQPAAARRERPLRHLARAVWIQALRRNELFTVVLLLGLYVLAALVLRIVGIDSAQSAAFVAGLGLQLASVLAAVLAIVLTARQMPAELELRTIYPILAKPVTRTQVLAGKALQVWALATLVLLLAVGATLLIAPRLAYQNLAMLAQAIALKAAALALLTALTLWLTLWMPMAIAMLLALALQFYGGFAANILAGAGGVPGRLFGGLIPDLKMLEPFQRYIEGGAPMSAGSFCALLAYGMAWAAIFAWLAAARFRRMPL